MATQIQYKDLNQDTPGVSGLVYGSDAIRQSLHNIFSTIPGERLFRPDFGLDLNSFVFAPINQVTALRLRNLLTYSVPQWDSRIQVVASQTSVVADEDESSYTIKVGYMLSGVVGKIFTYTGQVSLL